MTIIEPGIPGPVEYRVHFTRRKHLGNRLIRRGLDQGYRDSHFCEVGNEGFIRLNGAFIVLHNSDPEFLRLEDAGHDAQREDNNETNNHDS